MEQVSKSKGPGNYPQSSKLFKRFLKIITLAHIYQLTKYGDLMSCGSKDIFKNAPYLVTNTHHDFTDFVNPEMVKNTKTWISWERNIAFPQNKKTYCFVVDIIFKFQKNGGKTLWPDQSSTKLNGKVLSSSTTVSLITE